jgi:hypothetical protein
VSVFSSILFCNTKKPSRTPWQVKGYPAPFISYRGRL